MKTYISVFGCSLVAGALLASITITVDASAPAAIAATPRDACFSTVGMKINQGTDSQCDTASQAAGDLTPGQGHFKDLTMTWTPHVKGKLICPSPSNHEDEYGGESAQPVVGHGNCGNTFPAAQCPPQFSLTQLSPLEWEVRAFHARHKNDGSHSCEPTGGESFQVVAFTGEQRGCDDSACKVDDDHDGYYVPDDFAPDCDDTDPDIYPGAMAPYDNCSQPDLFPSGHDYNCDGVDDLLQLEDVCEECPIIIDAVGNGFDLTNRANGVRFDIIANGRAHMVAWPEINSDDAWLVLDRNGNGLIESGAELFGNHTDQPASTSRNGFLALAVFDRRSSGGNGDGWIDEQDRVFQRLRLWRDGNHDGVTAAAELIPLEALGIRRLSLDYRDLRRVDQWGNWFRYGARVLDGRGRDVGPWAFDVFLGARPPRQRASR